MSQIESLFFYGMEAFLIIGLLALCYRVDQLENENKLLREIVNETRQEFHENHN